MFKNHKQRYIYQFTDFFGLGFNFLLNGNRRIYTGIRTVFTIFYLFVIVVLFFTFGRDMYLRKNPLVSMNASIESYRLMNITNDNFIYAYRIEDYMGKFINDSSLIYFEVLYVFYEMNSEGIWELKEGHELVPK